MAFNRMLKEKRRRATHSISTAILIAQQGLGCHGMQLLRGHGKRKDIYRAKLTLSKSARLLFFQSASIIHFVAKARVVTSFLFICSVLFVTRYYGPLFPCQLWGNDLLTQLAFHLFPRLVRFRIDGHQRQFPPTDAKGHTHTIFKKRKEKKPEPNGHRKVEI